MSQKHDPAHSPAESTSNPSGPLVTPHDTSNDTQPPVTLESWLAAAPQPISSPQTPSAGSFSSEAIPTVPEPTNAPVPIAAPPPLRAVIRQAPPPIQVVSIPATAFQTWHEPERPIEPFPAADPIEHFHSEPAQEPSALPDALAESDWVEGVEPAADAEQGSELEFVDEPTPVDHSLVEAAPIEEMTPILEQPQAEHTPDESEVVEESLATPQPTAPSPEPSMVDEADLLAVSPQDSATHPADDLNDLFDEIEEIGTSPLPKVVAPEPLDTAPQTLSPETPLDFEPAVVEPVDPLAIDFAIGSPSGEPEASQAFPMADSVATTSPATIVDETLPPYPQSPVDAQLDADAIPAASLASESTVATELPVATESTVVAESRAELPPIAPVEPLAIAPQGLVAAEPSKAELAAIPPEPSEVAAMPAIAVGTLVASAAAPETVESATATEVFAHAHEEVEARRGILALGLLTKLSGLAGLLACMGGLLMVLIACAGLTPTTEESMQAVNDHFIQWVAIGMASLLALHIGMTVLTKQKWTTVIPTIIATLLTGGLWMVIKFHHDQLAGYDVLQWSIYLIYASLGGLAVAILGGLIEHRRMREESHVLAALFVNVLGAVGGTLLLAVSEGWKIFK